MPGISPPFYINGYQCWIHLDDPTSVGIVESWPSVDEGQKVEVAIKCLWDDKYPVARELMGYSRMVGGVISRVFPFRYPASPELACQAIGPIGRIGLGVRQVALGYEPAGWIYGDYAVLPATFAVPKYEDAADGGGDLSGQPYTTTQFRTSGEVFTPPNGTFYYQDGGMAWVPVHDSLLGIVRPKAEISMTRHQVPAEIDTDRLMSLIGGTNAAPVRFGNRNFPRGTILVGGFNMTQNRDSRGNRTGEIEYGLLGNYDKEWNELMGQDSMWHIMNSKDDGSGEPPFKYVDFGGIP